MIDVNNSSNQNVDISAKDPVQEIEVTNIREQEIDISISDGAQNIDVENAECAGGIEISMPCPLKAEIKIAIDEKVPKTLSVLPPISSGRFGTSELRNLTRVYVDADGTPCYATLEQIKRLGTKTIYVDALTDDRINSLSSDDTIFLNKE